MKKVRGRDGEAHWENHTIYSNVNNNNRRDAFSTLNEIYPPPLQEKNISNRSNIPYTLYPADVS